MPTSATNPVAVVTGASAGIGKATAIDLVRMGWHVIGTGRDPGRTSQAEEEIRAAASPGARIEFLRGDFCEMKDVLRVARAIRALTDRVDVLINNAGGVRDQRYVSSEGLEATMAANHFAPFLLTRELMPLLRTAAGGSLPGTVRVLAVSSSAHLVCEAIRWDDLFWEKDYAATPIYCQAKLCNILFTRELNRRIAPEGMIAQVMHPGRVDSNFASHGDTGMQQYFAAAGEGLTPQHAADTLVWMATSAETGVNGGRYFHDRKEEQPGPQGLDDAAAVRLWTETERVLATLGY